MKRFFFQKFNPHLFIEYKTIIWMCKRVYENMFEII